MTGSVRIKLDFIIDVKEGAVGDDISGAVDAALQALGVKDGFIRPGARMNISQVARPKRRTRHIVHAHE